MKSLFTISFCIFWHLLVSQGLVTELFYPASIGKAQTGIASLQFKSVFSNPALIQNTDGLLIEIFSEMKFGLKELSMVSIGISGPVLGSSAGFHFTQSGTKLYKEQRIGLVLGKMLFQNLQIGIRFSNYIISAEGYEKVSVLSAELGFISSLREDLSLGFHVYNPFPSGRENNPELPIQFNMGLSFENSEKTEILLEIAKELGDQLRVKVGIDYKPSAKFSLRMGVISQPFVFTFGLGYHLEAGYHFDIANLYHQTLGFSPSAGFSYEK